MEDLNIKNIEDEPLTSLDVKKERIAEEKKFLMNIRETVNKMSLFDLQKYILDFGKLPDGKSKFWESEIGTRYKGTQIEIKFNMVIDELLKRRRKIIGGLVTAGGASLGLLSAGVIGGSAIGISKAVQHSKNSKRTETRNGIVDK